MDRAQHLQWCKDRAIEYVNADDLPQAWASMVSDMRRHEKTANHIGLKLGIMMMLAGELCTTDKMLKFIESFN